MNNVERTKKKLKIRLLPVIVLLPVIMGINSPTKTPPVATVKNALALQTDNSKDVEIHFGEKLLYPMVQRKQDNRICRRKNIVSFNVGSVKIDYDLTSGTGDFSFEGTKKITGAYSMVKTDGVLTSRDYDSRTYEIDNITGNFGSGKKVTVTNSSAGKPTMKQIYYLYEDKKYFVVEVTLEDSHEISSNLMAPVVVNGAGAVDIGKGNDNRIIFMPYDNETWHDMLTATTVNSKGISFEVTAMFDNNSRNGLVFGSITHDFWKTGIEYKGSDNKLDSLSITGGFVLHAYTNDECPHGAKTGRDIRSPKIFVGFFEDWREGLEEFADANTKIIPAKTWNGVKPVGWSSWGAFHTNMTFDDAMKSSDYIKTKLQDRHYHGENGVTFINLDAWSTKVEERMGKFLAKIKSNNQTLGMYLSPFSYWGDDMNAKVPHIQSDYKWGDLVLKTYDGEYYPKMLGTLYHPLDPTHPGTKELIKFNLNRYKAWGVRFLKLDFMNGGSCEGRHYDPHVKSGKQAYLEGMNFISENARYDDGTEIFLDVEISPYFPYQYIHDHLVTSDIHHGGMYFSKYTLSCITYGWWRNKLFRYIDSGIFTFEETDNIPLNDAELARTRVNAMVVAGSPMIVCINPSRTDQTSLSERYLNNAKIMELARLNKAFTPVEGGQGTSEIFVYKHGDAYYIGVFNFKDKSAVKTINLPRAGINGDKKYIAKDLWTKQEQVVSGSFDVNLKQNQSTILKLTLIR